MPDYIDDFLKRAKQQVAKSNIDYTQAGRQSTTEGDLQETISNQYAKQDILNEKVSSYEHLPIEKKAEIDTKLIEASGGNEELADKIKESAIETSKGNQSLFNLAALSASSPLMGDVIALMSENLLSKSYNDIVNTTTQNYADQKAIKAAQMGKPVFNTKTKQYEDAETEFKKMDIGILKAVRDLGVTTDEFDAGFGKLFIDADSSEGGIWAYGSRKNPETGEYEMTKTHFKDMSSYGKSKDATINAYGARSFKKSLQRELLESTATSLLSAPKGFSNLLEGIGTLSYKYAPGLVTMGVDKALGAQAEYLRGVTKAYGNIPTSEKTDESMFNASSITSGVGQGVGSLLSAGSYGKWTAGVASSLGLGSKQIGAKAFERLVNMGAGAVLNYDEAYTAALDAGLSKDKAATMGFIIGSINGLIESSIGANALMNKMAGVPTKEALAIVRNELGEDLSESAIRKAFPKIFNKYSDLFAKVPGKSILKTSGEEGLEEFLQTYGQKVPESIYDSLIARDKEVGKGKYGSEVFTKDTFMEALSGALSGAIVGGLGGIVSKNDQAPKNIQDAVVDGQYESVLHHIHELYNNNAITEPVRDKIIANLNKTNDLWEAIKPEFNGLNESKGVTEYKQQAFNTLNELKHADGRITQIGKDLAAIQSNQLLTDNTKRLRTAQKQRDLMAYQEKQKSLNQFLDEFYYTTDANGVFIKFKNHNLNYLKKEEQS